MRKLLLAMLFGGLALHFPLSADAAELVIHMRPDGDDAASGLSPQTAMKSLPAALERAFSHDASGLERMTILVAPGIYQGQSAVIRELPNGRPFVITAVPGGDRPVFDGEGRGKTWLVLKSATGAATLLTVSGLEIRNYLTAISLAGDRRTLETSNSENVIHDNVFRNIGQISAPESRLSTAAIRLVNSDNNRITENKFLTIRNIESCGGMHAIYVAHYSTGNLIAGNLFDDGCGATVKLRDASDNNRIVANEFRNQDDSVLLDAYCDKRKYTTCTKGVDECPSWNNVFQDNTMRHLGPRSAMAPVRTTRTGVRPPDGCPAPAAGWQRIMQYANQQY